MRNNARNYIGNYKQNYVRNISGYRSSKLTSSLNKYTI